MKVLLSVLCLAFLLTGCGLIDPPNYAGTTAYGSK